MFSYSQQGGGVSANQTVVCDADTMSELAVLACLQGMLGPEFAQLHLVRPHKYSICIQGFLTRIEVRSRCCIPVGSLELSSAPQDKYPLAVLLSALCIGIRNCPIRIVIRCRMGRIRQYILEMCHSPVYLLENKCPMPHLSRLFCCCLYGVSGFRSAPISASVMLS